MEYQPSNARMGIQTFSILVQRSFLGWKNITWTPSIGIGSFKRPKTLYTIKMSNKTVQEENKPKLPKILYLKTRMYQKNQKTLLDCQLSNARSVIQSSSTLFQQHFLVEKNDVNIFIPNWQFRETKKRLQLENTEYRHGRRQAKTYQNVCFYIPRSMEISIIF